MKITYILPVASHARFHKRITALESLGVESQILAFERDYYKGKTLPQGYVSLGYISHRSYGKRLFHLLKAIPIVYSATKHTDVIYAFGLDNLLLAWLSSIFLGNKPRIVYEVGDIREILVSDNFTGRIMRALERMLVRHINLLVVTSQAYIDGYFYKIQELYDSKYLVIENKLLNTDFEDDLPNKILDRRGGVIKIGYFGLIRCQRSWEVLKGIAQKGNGRFQVIVRGILGETLKGKGYELEGIPYIKFHGPYVNPDDLPAMYNEIDLVWVAHFVTRPNVKWSRVNRFYEACYFRRPMIGQEGTQDGIAVKRWRIGMCIDLRNEEEAIRSVLNIKRQQVNEWQRNIFKLPSDVYLYTNEHERLLSLLSEGSK